MVRSVKRESSGANGGRGAVPDTEPAVADGGGRDRRLLRSRYLGLKSEISKKREDLTSTDCDKFSSIINEVENLHQLVIKPREQVADAEALLDITNTLMTSVKAHGASSITPSDFVSRLLRQYGQQSSSIEGSISSDFWKDVGHAVSHVFRRAPGCRTMMGPMDVEAKTRKQGVRRRHVRPTERSKPEEIDDSAKEERTDTDKNMATMFNILRSKRKVGLENLILNRKSFAQTIENLFALSFLVKDGRAEIKVDDKGCHSVMPKNAPAAEAVASKEVAYNHFVFRFDFKDWKLMSDYVGAGEELMPHRSQEPHVSGSQLYEPPRVESHHNEPPEEPQTAAPTTPIRKFSRNRGLVLQEQTAPQEVSPEVEADSIVEDSPICEDDDDTQRIRKGKRKLR